MNKTAASITQFAMCILHHAYSRTTASFQLYEHNKNFIACLTSWHNSIFGSKLRTD